METNFSNEPIKTHDTMGDTIKLEAAQTPPPVTRRVNIVYKLLSGLSNLKTLGIELVDDEDHVIFTRGNVSIRVPSIEVLIFGAKSIFAMFRELDK